MKFLIGIIVFMLPYGSVIAGPADTIREIIDICEKEGYTSNKCNARIYGKNRAIFSVITMNENRLKAEKNYKQFLSNYDEAITVYSYKFDMNINMNFMPKFNWVTDEHFQRDGKHFVLLPEKEGEPIDMVLIKDEGVWKLAFTNDFEKMFRSSKLWPMYLIGLTRTNILNYHIAKARRLGLSKSALMNQVGKNSIPLVIAMKPEKREEFKEYLSIDVNDIITEYAPLDTDIKIQKKLDDENS